MNIDIESQIKIFRMLGKVSMLWMGKVMNEKQT